RAGGALSRDGGAARRNASGHLRRLLLPERQCEDAAGAQKLPAGANRGADEGVRGGREARRGLRADDSGADQRPREAFLHQQPADRSRASRARRHPAEGRGDGMTRIASAAIAGALLFGAAQAPAPAPAPAPLQRLQSTIETLTRSVNANWGIYVKSLETNEE